jgi:ketosteroid isomerase-like protein
MPRTCLSVAALAAVAALTACASGADPGRYVEALLAADNEFAARSRAQGAADAFHAFLADDAIELPRQGEAVTGRAAIVDGLRALDDGWVLDWTPMHAEASADGTLGWTWGRYELYRADSPDAKATGKYLNVWRRGADGRWRVAADIGNQAPRAPD